MIRKLGGLLRKVILKRRKCSVGPKKMLNMKSLTWTMTRKSMVGALTFNINITKKDLLVKFVEKRNFRIFSRWFLIWLILRDFLKSRMSKTPSHYKRE